VKKTFAGASRPHYGRPRRAQQSAAGASEKFAALGASLKVTQIFAERPGPNLVGLAGAELDAAGNPRRGRA
jgi:hypothetical protein